MLKISKEVRTGILAIIALVIVIGGYNYLKGKNLLDKNRNFYALYDNVEGLTPGANVTINGLTVGKVISIKFADKTGMLKVHFDVVSDFEFSNKSIARVYGIGFISGKNLAIVPSYEGEPAKDGDFLTSEIDNGIMELVTERLEPLQAVIESAINDTDSLVKSVNSVLDKDTQSNLKEAIANFSVVSRELKTTSRSMNGLLADNKEKLNGTITNFEEISSNFAKISDSLSQVEIGALLSNIENLVSDFEGIANNLKSGEGTV